MQQAAAVPFPDARMARVDVREMYVQHVSCLRSLLFRLLGPYGDPDDVLQEVFVVALQKLDAFTGGSPRPWLCGIAVRLATAARRRARLRERLGLGEAPEAADWRTPDRLYERDEASRVVFSILDQLSEKKRTAFILYEIQGLSAAEIAAALGCPLKTVWSRLEHARREFLELLERQSDQEAASSIRRRGVA